MGPSEEKPNSGGFVVNQFNTLNEQSGFDVEFFYLNQDKKAGIQMLPSKTGRGKSSALITI